MFHVDCPTCPERFPTTWVVKAKGEESTSCGTLSVGRGCVQESELVTWPVLTVSEVEYLSLPEVVVVEQGWLEQVAQEERSEEEVVLESRWKRKVEVR